MNIPTEALTTELLNLQRTTADRLRSLPGAVALYAFGSLTSGTSDCFSDVDLELFTTDLGASLHARHAVFEQIGPVSLEWRIHPSRSDWASTLVFEHVSPYHKVDIGFTEITEDGQWVPPEGSRLMWRQVPPMAELHGLAPMPYMPDAGTLEHWVMGHLLGITRYVKARKRRQDLTCWRFASAVANAAPTLLRANHANQPLATGQKLSTLDYLYLDSVLPEASRAHFLSMLDFSRPEGMDRSVHALLQEIVSLLDGLPGHQPVPNTLTQRLLHFVEDELTLL